MSFEPSNIKDIVLNTEKPCVISGLNLSWKCLTSLSLNEWCSHLDNFYRDGGVPFEVATTKHNEYPQWERNRQSLKMTMKAFMDKFNTTENSQQWATFSYKNIKILPKECQEGVNFERLGFPQMEYVNFWFGSKGAHTPCHYDTYGCNIVVQVYGSKSWLLFPPNECLTPIRVPYEESSIFCKENFYSPNDLQQFEKLMEPRHVILRPGDVLIIPRHWWHYAENMETSLSINTWVPLDIDVESQIDECVVQTQIYPITQRLSDDLREAILNPNEIETMYSFDLLSQLKLLKSLLLLGKDNPYIRIRQDTFPCKYLPQDKLSELLQNFETVQIVKWISSEELRNILKINSSRFDSSVKKDDVEEGDEYKSISFLINSVCKPDVVQKIKASLLNELSN